MLYAKTFTISLPRKPHSSPLSGWVLWRAVATTQQWVKNVWRACSEESTSLDAARVLIKAGNYSEALHLARLTSLRYPQSAASHLAYADLCQSMGMYSEALNAYDTCCAASRSDVERHAALEGTSACHWLLGNVLHARHAADRALEIFPTPRALFIHGVAGAVIAGKRDEARSDIALALQDPRGWQDPVMLTMRGLMAYLVGDYEGALRLFDKALTQSPNHPTVLAYRGLATLRHKGVVAGNVDTDAVLRDVPFANVETVIFASQLFPVGQKSRTYDLLRRAIEMESTATHARYLFVVTCCQVGTSLMLDEARQCVAEMDALNPLTDLACVTMALAANDVALARLHLDRAREKGLATSVLGVERVSILWLEGEKEEALAEASSLVLLMPSPQAWGLRGMLSLELFRYADAVADLERVAQRGHKDPRLWVSLAEAHRALAGCAATAEARAQHAAQSARYKTKADAHPFMGGATTLRSEYQLPTLFFGEPLEERALACLGNPAWSELPA